MGSQSSILRGRHKPICSFKRPFAFLIVCGNELQGDETRRKTPVWCHYCSLCKWWCMRLRSWNLRWKRKHSRYTLETRLWESYWWMWRKMVRLREGTNHQGLLGSGLNDGAIHQENKKEQVSARMARWG